jgi:hypothetical protein
MVQAIQHQISTCARWGSVGVLCASLLPLLAGCVTSTGGSSRLVSQPTSHIQDIPLPTGFSLEEKRSRSFYDPATSLRWVDYAYTGQGDKFSVAQYYEQQMPTNGWTPATRMFTQGQATLDFRKNREHCRLTLSGSSFGNTRVEIAIWPTADKAPDPPAASHPNTHP